MNYSGREEDTANWRSDLTSFSDDCSSGRLLKMEDVSPSYSREENIEILSQDEDILPPSVSQTNLTKAVRNDNSNGPEAEPTTRHSRVARVIACTAVVFLAVCLMMVGMSLFMSKDIDEIVRNSNEMLKKHNDRISSLQADSAKTATNITGNH